MWKTQEKAKKTLLFSKKFTFLAKKALFNLTQKL